ncbi:hypothetical protein FKE98_08460 [Corynebacterium aurimucosum]|uniref:hypothetical protein n=1 Tax=Corynebacterium guaraldiae TaxID=3051103 RepID=UPI0012B87442|nr:hypothetical protein [Corynebacterium guaraldiae]MTE10441.1 hypothetical protein [Corynebacterium guaraldiae]
MKNSAAVTAEPTKKHFAYKITRIATVPQGGNFQVPPREKTLPKLLLFLLFSAKVFDKNTAGKRVYQQVRARDLGLVCPARSAVGFVVFAATVQVNDFQQKATATVVFVVFGGFPRFGGGLSC